MNSIVQNRPRIVAFAPQYNTGTKKDATGAFIPEAKAFIRFFDMGSEQLYIIDNNKPAGAMKKAVFAALEKEVSEGTLHGVAFFCHGLKDRIQFGIRKSDIIEMCRIIAKNCRDDVRVTFYCCDTGRDDDADRTDDLKEFGGDNGFADTVRDVLCSLGKSNCVVDSHTSAAHTTMNADVRRFEGMGSPLGGIGGYYIVPREKRALFAKWRAALKTDIRFQFPYWSTAEIHRVLMKDV